MAYGIPNKRSKYCGVFKCGAEIELPRIHPAVVDHNRERHILCPQCGFSESEIDEVGNNPARLVANRNKH